MSEPEARYPCPVCLGLPMNKIKFGDPLLILDACSRCGGMWFDAGEVEQLKHIQAQVAMKHVELQSTAFRMQCHQCSARMDRNADHCPQCHWTNILECPVCQKPMKTSDVQGLKLDYCKGCKGVWFDNIELAAIWNGCLERMAESYRHDGHYSGGHFAADVAETFLDVLTYAPDLPDLVYYSGEAIVQAPAAAVELVTSVPDIASGAVEMIANTPDIAGSVVEGLANAPDVAGVVVEGVASVAEGVFEAIGAIIGGIFDGW